MPSPMDMLGPDVKAGGAFARRARRLVPWIAAAVAALALVVLTGWVVDSTRLKSILPGMTTMKVNTALGLLLYAEALWMLYLGNPKLRGVTLACVSLVFVLSALTLAEYAFGIDLRIDNFLFVDHDHVQYPGRNAPGTLLSFIAIGTAYLLLERNRLTNVAQAILLLGAVTPLVALGGYLYHVPGMYANTQYQVIALHTAVGLLLLCVGGLFASSNTGLMAAVSSDSTAGAVARKSLPLAVVLPLLTGLGVLGAERANWYTGDFGMALFGSFMAGFIVVAICWTATLWRREEITRHAAEDRLYIHRRVLDRMLEGVVVLDEHVNIMFTNPAFDRMFGYEAGELIGKHVAVLHDLPPDENARVIEQVSQKLKADGAWSGQFVNRRKNGERFTCEAHVSELDVDGKTYRIAVQQDVTGRRKAQQDLRDSEERFRALAETIPQLAWMARSDGSIDWYNRRWYDYTGTTFAQMEGWGWRTVHDPAELPRVEERFRQAVAKGESWEDTFPLRRYDGAMRWHLSRAMPLKDQQGNVLLWFGTNTDITESREAQINIRNAKEAAERANQAKDRFLAILSHELRTPLTPVLATVESLAANPRTPPELLPDLHLILRNVELEARLIDDLLDLTRVAKGKLQLSVGPMDLHAAVHNVLEICQSDLVNKNLRVDVKLEAAKHNVHGDSARLQQVFWNILRNAIKFTPAGGAISIRSEDDAGRVRVTIEDTGVGISPEVMPTLFNAFEQGGREVGRRFGGLGLGLAIAKAITELHGGSISAHSAGADQGTRVMVSLEAVDTQAVAEKRRDDRPALRALRILLVEDHPDTQVVMARLLRHLGHEVACAGSVAEALAAANVNDFDLIISDIGLPDGTGLDFLRRLRETKQTPAIALTGFGMDTDVKNSADAGFVAHLTKPVSFERLEMAIHQAVNGAGDGAVSGY